jgi:hypothetical protein
MFKDMTNFRVLTAIGKGLSPTQQAWNPIDLETYAQLCAKRAQKNILGNCQSLCWTDHQNVARLQTAPDIDVKQLRWVSEIIGDGSRILSLSGRSAKLADGWSRNPPDRDELLAQRLKDLRGYAGQLRGFSPEEYMSEWESPEGREAVPWTMPTDAVPTRGRARPMGKESEIVEPDDSEQTASSKGW